MADTKPELKPGPQMIVGIEPQLRLSGDIDRIFEEVMKPKVTYNFTVSLTLEQIADLLGYAQDHLEEIGATVKAGGNVTTCQLILEFTKAINLIQKS